MGKKILVVDDEADILKVVSFRLAKKGYEVLEATDGPEALDVIRNKKPDLVLLDLALPTMSGYEVCKKVKEDEKLKHIPILFLTASHVDDIQKKMKGYKADGCLVKPFEPEDMLKKVEKFIGR